MLPPVGPDVCVTLLSVAAVWLLGPYVGSIAGRSAFGRFCKLTPPSDSLQANRSNILVFAESKVFYLDLKRNQRGATPCPARGHLPSRRNGFRWGHKCQELAP